jgi:hypothetical protein
MKSAGKLVETLLLLLSGEALGHAVFERPGDSLIGMLVDFAGIAGIAIGFDGADVDAWASEGA